MTTDVDLDIKINDKIKINIDEPSRYKVVFLNDDQTPMDFVISLITKLFKHSDDSALSITLEIHEKGSGVVGIYSYEIAEQKSVEATNLSRDSGFPLRIKIEEE